MQFGQKNISLHEPSIFELKEKNCRSWLIPHSTLLATVTTGCDSIIFLRAVLTGSLSHLPPLASEASHALLSPLGTHSTSDVKQHGDGVTIGDNAIKGS
jgi:hypothetical protein